MSTVLRQPTAYNFIRALSMCPAVLFLWQLNIEFKNIFVLRSTKQNKQ